MTAASDWTRADWERVHELFSSLRDESSEVRESRLADLEPLELRDAVRELLDHHDRSPGEMRIPERPAQDALRLPIPEGFRALGAPSRGGMGVVVEAQQAHPARRVALKFLASHVSDAAHRWRFEREIELLARLRHPGIARLYEAGITEEGQPWFAMEYVPGARDLLTFTNEQRLRQSARIELFISVCEAVHHAHLRGVLHRDLKPQNILVDEDGRAVVIDFGVGRLLNDDEARRTQSGEWLGTVRYMSPEQLGEGEIEAETDVFSLGVVLFELLTGSWPFRSTSTNPLQLAEAVRGTEPLRLSDLGPSVDSDLETIVAKSLEKEPARRYASADEFAADLRAFLERRPISARPASFAYHLRVAVVRHRLALGAAGLVLLSLLGGLALALDGWREARAAAVVEATAKEQARKEQLHAEAMALAAERERVRAEAERDRAQTVLEFLCRGLGAANPRNMGRDVTVRAFVDQVSRRAATDFATDPLVQARLFEATGRVYLSMGEVETARNDLQRSLDLRRAVLEEGHPDRVALLGFLADASIIDGHYDHALGLAEEALDEHRAAYDGQDPDTEVYTALLTSWGMSALQLGRFAEARDTLREALRRKEIEVGPSADSALSVKGALGMALGRLGEIDEARGVFIEILEVQESRGARGLTGRVMALSSLNDLERSHGDANQAVVYAREALELGLECYGESHIQFAKLLHGLGLALMVTEELDESEELLLRAMDIFEANVGPESPLLDNTEAALALLHQMRAGRGPDEGR